MNKTLAAAADDRVSSVPLDGNMDINPYEPISANELDENDGAQFSSYFNLANVLRRFSVLYVFGTVCGIVLVVAPEAGVGNAIRELVAPGGLRMLSITMPFACLASMVYPMMRKQGIRQMFIRLLAGTSLGASFFLMVWRTSDYVGDILGVNMHANVFAIFLFPLVVYLIAICISVLTECLVGLAFYRDLANQD